MALTCKCLFDNDLRDKYGDQYGGGVEVGAIGP